MQSGSTTMNRRVRDRKHTDLKNLLARTVKEVSQSGTDQELTLRGVTVNVRKESTCVVVSFGPRNHEKSHRFHDFSDSAVRHECPDVVRGVLDYARTLEAIRRQQPTTPVVTTDGGGFKDSSIRRGARNSARLVGAGNGN